MPMSSPLHPGGGGDNKSISHSEANDAPESTPDVDFGTPGQPFDIINFPTTPPTHLYSPTGSSHGCDKSLTSNIRPHQTLQPHDSVRGNTKRKRKNSRQSIRRIPKDSGVTQGMPRGTFSSTIPPIYSNSNTSLTSCDNTM